MNRAEKIAVIGLGYVGLPVAVAFGRAFKNVIGFDISPARLAALENGRDDTGEVSTEELAAANITFSGDKEALKECNIYVVCVPTPIDENRQPDLRPIIGASEIVGATLGEGDLVIYESTVYPGLTEDICGPVLARSSGLSCGTDFKLGYSPERINPGDKVHRLETITKVVSGQDTETLERVAALYQTIIEAGIHKAPSIRVAEAAKVIENTQRDLNIALMNELAVIFEKLDVRTADVLAAAGTKWNFLPFTPGLVGGHCIGVDPYYLTTCAEKIGYSPQVILSGRRINDGMGAFVAQKTVKLLVQGNHRLRDAKVGILGLTFKENVTDMRNSRVPDIIAELEQFGISPLVHDAMADPEQSQTEYDITLCGWQEMEELDALILAVPHRDYLDQGIETLAKMVKTTGVFIDLKSVYSADLLPQHTYWSL